MSELIDISEDVTSGFYDKVTKGKVLGFEQDDGSVVYYKIVRLDRRRKIAKMIEYKLYDENELKEMRVE